MKIISLNTAHALFYNEFISFVKEKRHETDVFCFQEVTNWIRFFPEWRKNLLQDISELLDEFNVIINDYANYEDGCIAIFIHKKWNYNDTYAWIFAEHYVQSHDWWFRDVGMYVWLQVIIEEKKLILINVHGLWYPWDKLENTIRIEQKNNIVQLLNQFTVPVLLIWDFNLHPDTDTIVQLWKKLNNLNQLFWVYDTRWAWTQYFGTKDYQPYADYAFASESICIKSYSTEEKVISDHKALLLSITL